MHGNPRFFNSVGRDLGSVIETGTAPRLLRSLPSPPRIVDAWPGKHCLVLRKLKNVALLPRSHSHCLVFRDFRTLSQLRCWTEARGSRSCNKFCCSSPYIKRSSPPSENVYLIFTLFIFFTYQRLLLLPLIFFTFSLLIYFILFYYNIWFYWVLLF